MLSDAVHTKYCLPRPQIVKHPISLSFFNWKSTHSVKDAIRSEVVKLTPALYLAKSPVAVSNDTSVPKTTVWFPATPEKLTTGVAVSPKQVLIPACS